MPTVSQTSLADRLLATGATRLETALAAALLAAVALNAANVVARYVFGQSITGADELQIYLMLVLAFFGSVVATVRRQHLRMDVLVRYFPAALQRLLEALEGIAAAVLCAFVCWISTQYALRMQQIGSVSENAHVPMWIPHAVVALAFAVMTVIGVLRLLPGTRPRAEAAEDTSVGTIEEALP